MPIATVTRKAPEPGPAFRKGVQSAIVSIVLFIAVYLLLILVAAGLAVLGIWAGLALIMAVPKFITIAAGIGLMGVGVLVFVFLIKFLFTVSRHDTAQTVPLKEVDQPELFAFIRDLAAETGVPFPKKILLSPDVNACVFYNSSFWSMFLPVRKNLQIGLGLVNAVNVSEFRAVIAHEFGHFSQRSMKLGSFVYQVNRIIYNMLYQNDSYGRFLSGWASVDGIFALFASVTAGIVRGIQYVLQQMYVLVNKSYLKLSREMEFHADGVAASVCGSNHMVSSLLRISLAGTAYEVALDKLNGLLEENKRCVNFYDPHRQVLLRMANDLGMPLRAGLPEVPPSFGSAGHESRVVFTDQWSSHPTLEERRTYMEQLNWEEPTQDEPAWSLFRQPETLQAALTGKLYSHLPADKGTEIVDSAAFGQKFEADCRRYELPALFHGFYDGRQPDAADPSAWTPGAPEGTLEELFAPEHTALVKKIQTADTELSVLQSIADKSIDVKSFDFDGTKYDRSAATEVRALVEAEQAGWKEALARHDRDVLRYFYRSAGLQGEETARRLKEQWEAFFQLKKAAGEFFATVNLVMEQLQPLYAGGLDEAGVHRVINGLKQEAEPRLKEGLGKWLIRGIFTDAALREKVQQFLGSDFAYFHEGFLEPELSLLQELCGAGWNAVGAHVFDQYKGVLTEQASVAGSELKVHAQPLP
ncbi:MAG TPA: M48 family metalloprotease [Chitinophagaceae bacterium]|nr:M48 family metalloprotease [Chitinophagaceae bacterium]